jgi:hypothetical protein
MPAIVRLLRSHGKEFWRERRTKSSLTNHKAMSFKQGWIVKTHDKTA